MSLEPKPASPISKRELILTRDIPLSAERLYRAWSTRTQEWWAPRPWSTPALKMDLRSGGEFTSTMRGPDGTEFSGSGVFLEVIPNRRIVWTDAFVAGWEPNPEMFFTAIITFEPLGENQTRYTARAMHWTEENCRKHAEMGFLQGWGQCLDQLVEVARQI